MRIPTALVKTFPGPHVGIYDERVWSNKWERPLLGGTVKPKLGLPPKAYSTIIYECLNDVLELSVNGTISALRLELRRYVGKPVDFLEISGGVTVNKALELENLIQNHLPPDYQVDLDKLGRYQSGLVERRSCPLTLTQLLITYHMITAGEAVFT